MFRLTLPLDDEVRRFIANQQRAELSYPEVGASDGSVPDGYTVDRNRIGLGSGERVWQRAVAAIRAWQMFNIPWLRLYWPDTPIQVGAVVAVSVRHFGFFSLNACRIVYVVDEDGAVMNAPVSRFGFAYGTLGSTPRAAKSASQSNGTGRATKSGTTFSLSHVHATHWRNSRTRYHVRCRRHSPNVQKWQCLTPQPKTSG